MKRRDWQFYIILALLTLVLVAVMCTLWQFVPAEGVTP